MGEGDRAFLTAFERQAIPLDEWNHQCHVRVAFLYLLEHPLEQVAADLPNRLRAMLGRFGIPDTLESGYHETVTQAWLRIIAGVLRGHGPYDTFDDFVREHPYVTHKRLLRLFYTRARLVSSEAKASFVLPDLAGLPDPSRPSGQ